MLILHLEKNLRQLTEFSELLGIIGEEEWNGGSIWD